MAKDKQTLQNQKADEPNFKRVGSARLSENKGALNLHFFEQNEFFSIPLTDIKLILFELKDEQHSEHIAPIRKYRFDVKTLKGGITLNEQ